MSNGKLDDGKVIDSKVNEGDGKLGDNKVGDSKVIDSKVNKGERQQGMRQWEWATVRWVIRSPRADDAFSLWLRTGSITIRKGVFKRGVPEPSRVEFGKVRVWS